MGVGRGCGLGQTGSDQGRDRSLTGVHFNPAGGAAPDGTPSAWCFLESSVIRESHQVTVKTTMTMQYTEKKIMLSISVSLKWRELGRIFTLQKQREKIAFLRQKQTLQYANNIVAIIKSYQTN